MLSCVKKLAGAGDGFLAIYKVLMAHYGPRGWWPARTRLEMMVGAILVQNTSWLNAVMAIRELKKHRLLSFSALKDVQTTTLACHIRSSGYYRLKAKRLKSLIYFIYAICGGSFQRIDSLPTGRLRQFLLGVCGIGPETCDSILLYGFKRPVFVIDAYTKRVFSRHRLFGGSLSYDDTQRVFMKNLPADTQLFSEYHALIVKLAKDHCRPVPKCEGCPLGDMKSIEKKPQ